MRKKEQDRQFEDELKKAESVQKEKNEGEGERLPITTIVGIIVLFLGILFTSIALSPIALLALFAWVFMVYLITKDIPKKVSKKQVLIIPENFGDLA